MNKTWLILLSAMLVVVGSARSEREAGPNESTGTT